MVLRKCDNQINQIKSEDIFTYFRFIINEHKINLSEEQINYLLFEKFGDFGIVFSNNPVIFNEQKQKFIEKAKGTVYLLHFLNYDLEAGYEYYIGRTQRDVYHRIAEHESQYQCPVTLISSLESYNPRLTERLVIARFERLGKRGKNKGSNYSSSFFNLTSSDLNWFINQKSFSKELLNSINSINHDNERTTRKFINLFHEFLSKVNM